MCLQVCPDEVEHFPLRRPGGADAGSAALHAVALIRVGKGTRKKDGWWGCDGPAGSPITDLEVAGKWR